MAAGNAALNRFSALNVWKRGDQRAPHKPLVLLYFLGRVQRGEPRLAPFDEVYEPLRDLIAEYVPSGKGRPEYPYWRLRSDGDIWEVHSERPLRSRESNTDPPKSELEASTAGFSKVTYEELSGDGRLVSEAAHLLLDEHFPSSLHEEIAALVGLDLEAGWVPSSRRRRRDPAFRGLILGAYEYRCGLCGYDGRLRQAAVGLDAAHVRWHQFDGPDEVANGIALCSLHHRMLDKGAWSLDAKRRVVVSQAFNGRSDFAADLVSRSGSKLLGPVGGQVGVDPGHIEWHQREVFQGPRRT